MIQAIARVLENKIELRVGGELWTCRPVVSASGAIARRLAALFATVYETHRSSEPEAVYSTVSYHLKKDEILIQITEQKWRSHSSVFGPMTIEYGGFVYTIHEKLIGKFSVLKEGEVLGQGEVGFRSCALRDLPADLEMFFANVVLGYLIRTLVWEGLR